MTPAQLCGFVDSLIIPVTQLNDPHAIDLLHQISYQSYCLLEGGDIDINYKQGKGWINQTSNILDVDRDEFV